MSRSIIAMLVLAAAAIASPVASAGIDQCVTTAASNACAYDGVYHADCFEFALTYVDVSTVASDVYAEGYHGDVCGASFTGMATGASVGPLFAGVVWYSLGSSCDSFVYYVTPPTGSQTQSLGCAAGGPPNPGWGEVLP